MASIRLANLEKIFPGGHVAVRDLDLEVAAGELLVLVGPSGCGKTTTLRMIAGLETPTRGRIFLDERDVTALPPRQRDVAMVFQNFALYPHKTVRQNLEFGLWVRNTDATVIAQRIQQVSEVLGLQHLLDRRPAELSGGERQRVALGRAIVRQPQAFLLDEPLSNLDAQLRMQTRAELARLHRRLGATMLYVTHDQEEAMTLGDRIAVMHEGRLQQVDTSMQVYGRPANVFVAGFIGSPAMNLFRGQLRSEDGRLRLTMLGFTLTLMVPFQIGATADLLVGIRPQDIAVAGPDQADVRARIDVIQPLGSMQVIQFQPLESSEMSITTVTATETRLHVGQEIGLHFPQERLHLFDASSGRRLV